LGKAGVLAVGDLAEGVLRLGGAIFFALALVISNSYESWFFVGFISISLQKYEQ
jgi:hypothetical protein